MSRGHCLAAACAGVPHDGIAERSPLPCVNACRRVTVAGVRLLSMAFLALSGSACSPSAPAAGNDASNGDDAGAGCLFCSDATDDAPLSVQIKVSIDHTCTNGDAYCHNAGAGNMVLAPGNEFADMINVVSYENPPMLRVKPGDPAQSYVYLKLACTGAFKQMCMPGGAPDPNLALLFHDWIEAGAPTE